MGPVLVVGAVVLALATGVATAAVASTRGTAPPPGATALCRDGTYSFSQTHSGTCSHHGGVQQWLEGGGAPGTTSGSRTPVPPRAYVDLGRTVLLGSRTKTSACKLGPNPDRRCSPGA
ncbi:MAG TPA: DUF3761 domain-containing protein, partial [Acidimicrobiia bacterium]